MITQQSLKDASAALNETNDCTVRCISVVTGLPYETVHEVCRQNGRRKRCGMYPRQWKQALKDLGYKLVDRTDEVRRAGGKTTRTVVNVLPTRPHIIHSYRHVSGWDGTKLIDWADGRLKRVQHVYEVVKLDGTPLKGNVKPRVTPPARPKRRLPRREIDITSMYNTADRGGVLKLSNIQAVYGIDNKVARRVVDRIRNALRKNGKELKLVAPKTWAVE